MFSPLFPDSSEQKLIAVLDTRLQEKMQSKAQLVGIA